MAKHISVQFMIKLYGNILVRFALYGAYGYAVSLAFSYVYYQIVASGSATVWNSATCPLMPYSAIAYLIVVGYFAVRDAIETNSNPLAGALKEVPARG